MRCKQCDYSLWGLESRRCPECGASFRPSDFEFKPNAVEFHCPDCDQPYFGTGEDGLLFPRSFTCVSCGALVDVDDMILRPASGVNENQTLAFIENPWTKRRGMSFFRPWIKTTFAALFHPKQLIHGTPVKSSPFSALWYAVMSQFAFSVTGFAIIFIIPLFLGVALAGAGGGFGRSLAVGVVVGVVAMLAAPVALIVVWALVTHATLRLTGTVKHGVGRTWQAICYSSGANILVGVPLFGIYLSPVSWIWWVVSAAQMLREGQKVSGLRAVIAAAAPPTLAVGALVWVIVVTFVPAMSSAMSMSRQLVETQTVASALSIAMASGAPPVHASQLVADGSLTASDFVFSDTGTLSEDIVVGSLTLDQLENATISEADAAVHAAADTLPADTIAYRVGDFVFTYQGVDPTDPAQAQLWVVVGWPDPAVNPAPSASETIFVGYADGTIFPEPVSTFQSMLTSENKIRARLNLPPIPHPNTVLAGKPASATDQPKR